MESGKLKVENGAKRRSNDVGLRRFAPFSTFNFPLSTELTTFVGYSK